MAAAAATLSAATSVCVIGGGTVGVELAAEVAGRYGTSKHVTLVSSSDRLLERMPPSAGAAVAAWLRGRGVRVMTGERVLNQCLSGSAPQTLRVTSGVEFKADVVYDCVGFKPLGEV